jgi:gamma-butyrobetaine dioxygenase
MMTGDLARYPAHHKILSAQAENRLARVVWDDNHESAFHYIWLRDNCFCPECRHPHSLERTFDLPAETGEIRPAAINVGETGALEITWQGDGHVSAYECGWLRAHCYSDVSRASRRRRPVLWGAELGNDMPTIDYQDVMDSDAEVLTWVRMLRDYGVSMIRGAPTRPDEVTRIAGRIGPLRETNFGRQFDVVSMDEPNSNAYTALHVGCHSDLPNWTLPPGLQLLHCLKNDAAGGGTMLVNGFLVADRLKRENRPAYDLLTRIPIKFRYQDAESDLVHSAPTIALDADGEIIQVRYNRGIMGVFDVPAAEMEAVYQAHLAFAALVRDPELVAHIRFAPGDVLVFDNRRILHGREAFDPSSGERHLQGCYVDIDDMMSRMRVLERRL